MHGRKRIACEFRWVLRPVAKCRLCGKTVRVKSKDLSRVVSTCRATNQSREFTPSTLALIRLDYLLGGKPSRGLGDIVAKVLERTGATKERAAWAFEKILGRPIDDCGCKGRQAELNKRFPI